MPSLVSHHCIPFVAVVKLLQVLSMAFAAWLADNPA